MIPADQQPHTSQGQEDCELCGKPIDGKPRWFVGKPHCQSCMEYLQRGDPDDLD